MDLIDIYRYLIGGYYGVNLVDEYDLKIYVLKDIEAYIDDFVKTNKLDLKIIKKENEDVLNNTSELTKLQDSLLVLNKIDGPIDLIIIIKQRIMKLQEKR